MNFRKTLVITFAFLMMMPAVLLTENSAGDTNFSNTGETNSDTSSWLSYNEVVPMRKTTLVGHDSESLVDDYAFMAAVPGSVFRHNDKLYSSPLLYYQEPYEANGNADLTMNPNQGLGYFLSDWDTAAEPEQIELINVPEDDIGSDIGNVSVSRVNSNNIYSLSSKYALRNWESSEKAVVAVVDDYPEVSRNDRNEGTISGTISGKPLATEEFFGTKSVGIEPIYHNFSVDEGYSYISARMEWGMEWTAGSEERGKDLDMQLYDWQLGQVAASENWNVIGTPGVRPYEAASSCIYNTEDWSVAVTYMPTEELAKDETSELTDAETEREKNTGQQTMPNLPKKISDQPIAPWNSDADYEIYVTEYPGTTVTIPEETFFMTKNADFQLSWEGGGECTLLVREPAGAEVAKAAGTSPLSLSIDQLGEGEHSVTVARMSDSSQELDFELSYSWEASRDRREGQSLASAANGAVWASMENSPLLYVKEDKIPEDVEEALKTLGVRYIDLIDFGDRFEGEMNDAFGLFERKLKDVNHYKNSKKFYKKISDRSGENDIVMTTMDPWTYWYSEEGPKGEEEGSRFVAPAAFAAAHHGAPVLIMELHPGLSNPQAWHNRFWLEAYDNRKPPSVGCMVLTGHETYDFLGDIGLDRKAEDGTDLKESILTVSGQFDIGTAWDRVLVGKAFAGRILGTPVDTSYQICRNIFYPLMVFANPAVNPELDTHNGQRITGSTSVFPAPGAAIVIDGGGEVEVENPNLYTWVSQRHRFNERAGKDGYWGCDYTTASGITPYRTPSDNPIDNGVNNYGPNAGGQYWPDMTISEVVPFYGEKAGYDSVYSTSWDPVAENLNRGVLLWVEGAHGSNSGGGRIGFWNPEMQQESNPWRAYEKGGCTEEIEGVNEITGNPWAAGPDTVRSDKNTGADYQPGYDGLVTAILEQIDHTTSTNGYQFDQDINNLHSVGISGSSCLISNTYLHISMIRHGSVFQVIDPWLTSWYSNFAIETFMRDIALGLTVGEAYANGIHHVGIEYLTGQWWWDIFENVVYFGDPDLRVYSPKYSWSEPESISVKGLEIDGHTPGGASEHPDEIESNYEFLAATGAGVILAVVVISWGAKRKNEDDDVSALTENGDEGFDLEKDRQKEDVEWEY